MNQKQPGSGTNTMKRRHFLRTTGLIGGALLTQGSLALAQATGTATQSGKIHGVNLGGWLVLEKWIKPGLFTGTSAQDEYTLCQTLGKAQATARLQAHRETWITADDFAWMKARGINSVRLPVGYWVAEENPPFITGRESLELAFRLAKTNGMTVLLDLHGVPGSQNGWDHSGRQGELGWHKSKENIAHSLRVIENLAELCQGYDNLLGIELVNEPRQDVPIEILKQYYLDAYQCVRKHLPPEQAAVVIHDSFRPYEWDHFMSGADYANVILDTHLYQCFSDADQQRDISGQLEVAAVDRKTQLDRMRGELPCIVGEWSLGLPPKAMDGLDGLAREAGMRAFGAAQLVTYESTRGWYFWTYRTEEGGGWSLRDSIERGWLPNKLNA
jgi:glucan 1,3-beta-glucosidase